MLFFTLSSLDLTTALDSFRKRRATSACYTLASMRIALKAFLAAVMFAAPIFAQELPAGMRANIDKAALESMAAAV